MLELKAVDARGVRLFDVEVVLIVVVGVDDPDAERGGVSKRAEVDAIDVEVLHHGEVAVDFQESIDLLQCVVEFAHLGGVVDDGFPKRGPPLFVGQSNALAKAAEAFVGDGEIALAFVAAEVAEQIGADGERRFFSRRKGRHGGRFRRGGTRGNAAGVALFGFCAAGGNGFRHGDDETRLDPMAGAGAARAAGTGARAGDRVGEFRSGKAGRTVMKRWRRCSCGSGWSRPDTG